MVSSFPVDLPWTTMVVHTLPTWDIREHVVDAGGTCWCKPVDLGDWFSHNALDGRERYEEHRARLN